LPGCYVILLDKSPVNRSMISILESVISTAQVNHSDPPRVIYRDALSGTVHSGQARMHTPRDFY